MMKFDYRLLRHEGDEEVIYSPTVIPKELENLVFIKAANASGKSTLLNILAVGLYGLKNDKINPSLRNRMNSLVDLDHQKLDAQFIIENRTGSPELKSIIKDGKYELLKFENGKEKRIQADRFERDYNLIYDIPENPTDRLRELSLEIKNIQQFLGSDISSFSNYLRTTIVEIKESRDPKKVTELEYQLNDQLAHQNSNNKEITELTELIDILRKLLSIKFFVEYRQKVDDTKKTLNAISRDNERQKGEKKDKKMHSIKLLGDIKIKFGRINSSRRELIPLLTEYLPISEKKLLDKWIRFEDLEDIKIENYVNDDGFGISLKKDTITFVEILSKEIEKKEYALARKESDIYSAIIDFFQSLADTHKNEEIILPGINKNIEDFIALLYSKNKQNFELTKKYDKITSMIKKLEDLEKDLDLMKNKYFKDYLNQKAVEESTIEDHKDLVSIQIDSLTTDLNKYQHKFEFYRDKCQDFGVNATNAELSLKKVLESKILPQNSKKFTEDQLTEEINSKSQELSGLMKEKARYNGEIKFLTQNINKMKDRKIHPFHDKLDLIFKIDRATELLKQKIGRDYENYLKWISEHKTDKINLSDKDQARYYEELSKYLAKKLNTMIYNKKIFAVKKLDLINDKITMENGKTIKLSDLGTGEGQAAFLKGKLETARTDSRKIIALFDEVGMIDDLRLNQVIESLQQLYKEDKLLLGIVVQKGQPGEEEVRSLL